MGFKWMIHERPARENMDIFIFEQWFKDGDKSGLKCESETWDFNSSRDSDSPSWHE